MTIRDDYMAVASEIARTMNAYGLAFKTFKVEQFDDMIKLKVGESSRISTDTTAEQFEAILQQCGFVVFPPIAGNKEGYVRVFRANSHIGNLLSAIRYPGANGDDVLARLLRKVKNRFPRYEFDTDEDE